MADELKARLSVDTSQFRTGMADAATSTRTLQDASKELAVALKDLASAEEELGPAIQNGSQQAVGILQEYRANVASLRAEVASLSATEEEETVTLKNALSARMMATAELRLAEGGFQGLNRAAAAYLTTLPGVAAAAEAAFAIAGPLAVIAILGQLVHAIDGVIEDYRSLSDAARQAAIDQAAAAAHGYVTVESKVGWFSMERIARTWKEITGNPDAQNAIQSAGGSDVTLRTVAGVERQNANQTAVLRSQNELNEAGLKGSALAKQKRADIQAEIDLLNKQSNALADVQYASQQVIRNQDSTQNQVKFAQQQITDAIEARETLNARRQALENHKKAEAKIETADTQKGDSKLARGQMQEAEERFAELNTKLPEEAIAFWRQYVDLFRGEGENATSEYTAALNKLNHFTEEFDKGLGKRSEVVKKFEEQQAKLADLKPPNLDNKWILAINEDLTKSGPRWNEYAAAVAKSAEISAQNAAAMQKEQIAIQQADGALSPLHARMQLAAIDAEEYRRKLDALNEQLARLKKEGADLLPGSEGYSKNQTQQAQLQNQILGVQGQAQISGAQNSEAIAKQMAQPYITAANDIQNAFTKAFTEVAMRQKSWQQAMAQSLVSLELSAAQAAEKWLMKWVDAEILSLAKHVLTNQQKVAADAATDAQTTTAAAAAASARQAIVTSVDVAEVLSYAAVAAAAAAAAAAPGGPPAMAAAATAAYAEVSAYAPLAAFDVGTNYVPKTGIAMIHEGERIIPKADNRQLMSALGNGGGSRITHVRSNITNNYNQPGRMPTGREQAAGVRDALRRGHL